MDILISEDLQSPAIQGLAGKYQVVSEPALWKDPGKLRSAIREAKTIMIRNQTQLTAEVLSDAPNLLGIGRIGVGLDNIAVETASKLGIVVVAPLNANAVSVAELTLGLILSLARKIPAADRSTKAGGWDRKTFTGLEIDGKVLAICGFGRIGRLVAARARAFGMRILVFDPFVKADSPFLTETGAVLCNDVEAALASADFVTVHSPLTPETRHLFNAKRFAVMKKGAFFINTSRGGVMDESALLHALQSNHLAGAGLDVREVEPPSAKSAFEALDNVILMPHVGAFTAEAQARTYEAVAADLDNLLGGKPAINFVNIPVPGK
jgi:D-3-phosphoglycerate dehydrogenase / 2-oxoglutarate reductase